MSANLGETGEHAAHRLVVEALRAVDHDDVVGERLAQIFDRLRLTRTCRTLRAAPTVKVEGRGQGHVTPKGQKGQLF